MKWQRVCNAFIFCPTNEYLENFNLNNAKISSNICTFYDLVDFTLDDINNISFNISTCRLSTSPAPCNVTIGVHKLQSYIHNIKISLLIRVEFKSASGIKPFTFSSYIGDFLISSKPTCNTILLPLLICLWRDTCNNYNATLTYTLIEKE